MKKIYIFSEENDWEGETWNFLVSLTEEEFLHIESLVDFDTYSITETDFELCDIEEFMSETEDENSYMPEYTNLTMCSKWLKPILLLTEEDIDADIFYKGKFWLN